MRHHIRALTATCARLHLPNDVCWTASTYMLRIYLFHSVLEYDPSVMRHTCLLLACKVAECNLGCEVLCNRDAALQRAALKLEIPLLSGMSYHTVVHAPFRPLRGILADMHATCPGLLASPDQEFGPVAAFICNAAVSDAALLYPPSQIALAAVALVLTKRDLSTYLQSLVAKLPGSDVSPLHLRAKLDTIGIELQRIPRENEHRLSVWLSTSL